MARRKAELDQDEMAALADRAQDLAIEISQAAERVSLMTALTNLPTAAQKFNQLAEAAVLMNRMLLAKAVLEDDKREIEARYASK